MPAIERFEPAKLSLEECRFLLQTIGDPPVVALHGEIPAGVNVAAVEPVLSRIYEYEQLRQHRGIEWAGIEAIKTSLIEYLEWHAQCLKTRRHYPHVRFASQFVWDSSGRPFKYGIGADSGDMIRTRILPDGTRKVLGVNLNGESVSDSDLAEAAPWLSSTPAAGLPPPIDTMEIDEAHGTMSCPICKFTQQFKPTSRPSQMACRSRMLKHFKIARTEKDRHAILYAKLSSGSG